MAGREGGGGTALRGAEGTGGGSEGGERGSVLRGGRGEVRRGGVLTLTGVLPRFNKKKRKKEKKVPEVKRKKNLFLT